MLRTQNAARDRIAGGFRFIGTLSYRKNSSFDAAYDFLRTGEWSDGRDLLCFAGVAVTTLPDFPRASGWGDAVLVGYLS